MSGHRSITDVGKELEDYAAGLKAQGFAPWVVELVRHTASLIARSRRHEAEAMLQDKA